jgi:hypothetical protein
MKGGVHFLYSFLNSQIIWLYFNIKKIKIIKYDKTLKTNKLFLNNEVFYMHLFNNYKE